MEEVVSSNLTRSTKTLQRLTETPPSQTQSSGRRGAHFRSDRPTTPSGGPMNRPLPRGGRRRGSLDPGRASGFARAVSRVGGLVVRVEDTAIPIRDGHYIAPRLGHVRSRGDGLGRDIGVAHLVHPFKLQFPPTAKASHHRDRHLLRRRRGRAAGRCSATGERPLTGFPPGMLGLVLLFPLGVLLMTAPLGFLQRLPQAVNLRTGPLQFRLLLCYTFHTPDLTGCVTFTGKSVGSSDSD